MTHLLLIFCAICTGLILMRKGLKCMMDDEASAGKRLLGYLIAVVIAIGEWPLLLHWVINMKW